MAALLPIALQLAQFAPHLMRFFGAGETSAVVVEKVVGIAQTVTGTESPEAALAALKASAEMQHAFAMRTIEIDVELVRLHLEDRQHARNRDVQVRQLNGGNNRRADLMIVGAVLGLIACLVSMVFFKKDIPGEVVGIIATISGIFGACLRDAFQFEFGSSRGSRDKDSLLAQSRAEK